MNRLLPAALFLLVLSACASRAAASQPPQGQPPVPSSVRLGPPLHRPVLSIKMAIRYAEREGALAAWFRQPYTATYGSWFDWVPAPAKSRRVDVWRIVVRNVTVPYRDCGHIAPPPGQKHQKQRCMTYHNVAMLVFDPSRRGAIFSYF